MAQQFLSNKLAKGLPIGSDIERGSNETRGRRRPSKLGIPYNRKTGSLTSLHRDLTPSVYWDSLLGFAVEKRTGPAHHPPIYSQHLNELCGPRATVRETLEGKNAEKATKAARSWWSKTWHWRARYNLASGESEAHQYDEFRMPRRRCYDPD